MSATEARSARDEAADRRAAANEHDPPAQDPPAQTPPAGPGAPGGGRLSPRQRALLALVRERGFATVEGLAEGFGVSAQTARREVIRLDALGLLQRFHGGAGALGPAVRPAYRDKRARDAPAKARIARAVAAMVRPGWAVFIDVGTTGEAVAAALRGVPGLRAVTASLPAAQALAGGGAEVFVTGGAVGGPDGSLVGAVAVAALARFRVDLAVIGFSGLEADGSLTDFDLDKVVVKQAALAGARRAVAAGVAAKLERPALVRLGPVSAFDALVTDAEPPPARRAAIEAAGGRLVVARG